MRECGKQLKKKSSKTGKYERKTWKKTSKKFKK